MFTHAITRLPAPNFADGLTTSGLGRPSYPLMLQQHTAYVAALRSLGLQVIVFESLPGYPDSYFVEDPAIVTSQVAIITRPGAPSRRGEETSLEIALATYRPIVRIQEPGTVDGGDVLIVGNHGFIGLSERTNREGAAQLAHYLTSYGFTSETVPVSAGLHLKSGVNYLGKNTLLVTQELANYPGFNGYEKLIVPRDEEYAANTLWVNDALLMPAGFPRTRSLLSALNLPVIELNVSEVQKMDGGLTCMSLRFKYP